MRTNADTPEDARKAREFGAEGIGLCRTEHMFFGEDRHEKMVQVILADRGRRAPRAPRRAAPLQQGDFEGLFEAMEGLPVTIRLLDPPLHEFLPDPDDLPEGPQRDRARSLQEVNPMLGTRGVRLGILYPEIYEMQVRAMMRAAKAVRERTGEMPHLEVMIPLVDYERELELMRDQIERVAHEEGMEHPADYTIGTMIELPRACFLADHIAEHADFFSFGTNDLTQTALGFSRDDIEGKILARYIDLKVFDRSPFETIDAPGRRADAAHGRLAGPQDQARHQARRLRRARRRPRLDRLLPPLGHRLRVLQPVPRARRARRRRPGRGARRAG